MSIRAKIIYIFSILIVLVIGTAFYLICQTNKITTFFNKDVPSIVNSIALTSELDGLSQLIRYYDEVLTQSARNYAYTGDKKWEDRYNEYVPKLDSAIKDAIAKGNEEDKSYFNSVDESNLALVKMEKESLVLSDQGQKVQAQAILDSAEYAKQKDIYKSGLQKYMESQSTKYDQALSVSTSTLSNITNRAQTISLTIRLLLIIFFVIILILLFIFYFILSNTVLKPIYKIKESTQKVIDGNLDQMVDVNKNDEIGALATTFNKMINNLKEYKENIEQKVHDQTKNIVEKQKDLEKQQKATLNVLDALNMEKRKTEESKAKDEAYLSSIGDCLIVVDNQGKIILTNPQVENTLGFRMEELIGKSFSDVIVLFNEKDKEIPVYKRPIYNVFLSGKKSTYINFYYLKKDKTKIPVALTTAPVKMKDKIIGAVDVFRDITNEKAIDKAKTEFVSLASHQLRTPLSAINWYTEMLMAGDVGKMTDDQQKYLNEIYKGNQRMVNLVNALLDVSRIELGTFAIEPKKIKLDQEANVIIKELKHEASKKQISLTTKFESDLPEMIADPKLIQIIIQNLLTNAIKYTPEKGKVSLTIIKKDPNILIEVADTGFGIPKAQQSQIFTKLFRADNVRAKDTEGTGLGLYIVKAIIDQSGGKIHFDSEENKGTTFYIALPLNGMKKKEGTKSLEDIK